MSKVRQSIGERRNSTRTAWLLLLSGVGACSAEATFSSSSNWLTCRTDDECVAAFGEGSCSTNEICVDENDEPIPLDQRTDEDPDSEGGADNERSTSFADAATTSNTASNEVTNSDASTDVVTTDMDGGSTSDVAEPTTDASVPLNDDPAEAELACSEACPQTSDFILPLALCEDWNVHRDGQAYEYCGSVETVPDRCEDLCTQVVTGASAACAETLPSVITCVADSGFYSEPVAATPMEGCLFPACQQQLLHMASACSERRERWQAATDLWNGAGMSTYQFRYDGRTIRVEAGSAMVVAGEPMDAPPTVPSLLSTIEASLETSERPIIVTYDSTLGYPTRLRSYQLDVASQCALATEFELTDFTLE